MNRFSRKNQADTLALLRRTQENDPLILPGEVTADYGNYTYDVSVRGKLIPGAHALIPLDGVYAEIIGKEVWVCMGTEPLIIGIRYPRDKGPSGALATVRIGYAQEF